MIILADIVCKYLQSVEVKLPRPNMVIDLRPNMIFDDPQQQANFDRRCKFECVYHCSGRVATLTLTEIDLRYNYTGHEIYEFRAYDPATEIVPSFNTTTYTYLGLDDEMAPLDTTIVFIHPSVEIIKIYAFCRRTKIQKCIMHDGVHTIDQYAFSHCESMQIVKMSRSMKQIEANAFEHCNALEALFIPPTIERIDEYAFSSCSNIRILPIVSDIDDLTSQLEQKVVSSDRTVYETCRILAHLRKIDIDKLGTRILNECHTFFRVTGIEQYEYDDDLGNNEFFSNEVQASMNNNQVHHAIIEFYRGLSPLHKTCLDTNVTTQKICDCISKSGPAAIFARDHDGMVPLHILAMNPHADTGAIFACADANMMVCLIGDNRHNTPLDYLRVFNFEALTAMVTSLCASYCNEGKMF